MLEPSEIAKLFNKAFAEAEAQLIHEIKAHKEDRPALLAELDVVQRVKERIHARIQYTDPLAD